MNPLPNLTFGSVLGTSWWGLPLSTVGPSPTPGVKVTLNFP